MKKINECSISASILYVILEIFILSFMDFYKQIGIDMPYEKKEH